MKNKPEDLSDLSIERRSDILSKVLFATSHLQLAMELLEDVKDEPIVWNKNIKNQGNIFLKQLVPFFRNMLFMMHKSGDLILDVDNRPIGSAEDIQLQAWELINEIKTLNEEALKRLSAELVNNEFDKQTEEVDEELAEKAENVFCL